MSEGALTKSITIKNELGLHARPAARFVECAGTFEAEITVTKDGETVPGTSIMGLLMFGAGPGTTLDICAKGPDAADALIALEALIDKGFGEISD